MNDGHQTLWLNGKVYTFAGLKDENPADFESGARSIVTFIRQWYAGREEFEAKTSGATGEPKKIMLQRSRMVASARLTQEALGLRVGMTALLCLDPDLIAGKMMMVRCLVTGLNLVAITPAANPLDHLPQDLHIDFAAMVPLQVTTIIAAEKQEGFKAIDKVIIGGGAVGAELLKKLQPLTTLFYATFGMTETLSHVALQKLNGPGRTDYFDALNGIEFNVDVRGCLCINATHLSPLPIVTNDIVKLMSPTRFIWLGRWDNIINTGGVKVIPESLEQQIATHLGSSGISNKFFIGSVPHETLGQEVVLVVEGILPQEIEQQMLAQLRTGLEKYQAPKRILYATRFELTTMGKIKRAESLASASPRPRI